MDASTWRTQITWLDNNDDDNDDGTHRPQLQRDAVCRSARRMRPQRWVLSACLPRLTEKLGCLCDVFALCTLNLEKWDVLLIIGQEDRKRDLSVTGRVCCSFVSNWRNFSTSSHYFTFNFFKLAQNSAHFSCRSSPTFQVSLSNRVAGGLFFIVA